jgi:hypothetical protein
MSSDSKAAERSARMVVRVYRSHAEQERDDAAYWSSIPAAERVLETWRLSEELWRLAGQYPDESGLRRSPARLYRR